jgi:hypothetical protein
MKQVLGLAAAAALLVFSGIVHGLWTNRWTAAAEIEAAVARLDAVPMTLGDWQGEAVPMSERDRALAGGAGYLLRRYKNRATGSTVTVFLVCGRPGLVSVHTPDVCFAGSGYAQTGGQDDYPVRVDGLKQPAHFAVGRFQAEAPAPPDCLRTFWSWNAQGVWQVAASPRMAFAGHKVLHKLYLVRRLGKPDEPLDGDPCLDLMKVLLPQLQTTLFAGP